MIKLLGLAAMVACVGGGVASAETFVLVTYETPAQLAERSDAARSLAYWARWSAAAGEMAKAGVLRGGSALRPQATRVGVKGRRNGPQMSGYFMLEASDSAAAAVWAERLHAAGAAAVDVRAVQPNPTMK